jgi:UDP-N-acetylmuramoyl-L-alanyl-D-glutamate--2,6-diaminopimelate ligase
MQEISDGVVRSAAVFREPDRHKAIRLGLGMAQRGDVVLVAGKGHETYQVTGDRKEHFDDREEVGQFILSAS